jgi:GWxTD domain-containing protein
MKRFSLCIGIICLLMFAGYAQKKKSDKPAEPAPKHLLGILNYNAYCTDEQVPYIEFQFIIDGSTAQYVPASADTYAAEVEIEVDIRRNQDEESVGHLHYILVSPQTRDSVSPEKTYFSDVRNIAVPNGDYYLYFKLKDVHGNSDTLRYIDYIHVNYPTDSVSVSGISLYSRVSRSGDGGVFYKYEMATTPLFQQYAPENIYSLPFSAEIYNTDKVLGKGEFIVKAEIAELGYRADPEYTMTRRMKTAPASIFIHLFNIYMLPSGNYHLNLYVMDADSNLVATSSTFFQRSNPRVKIDLAQYDGVVVENTFVEKMTDLKQLQYDVATLYPIGNRIEQDFFTQNMKKVPIDQLQRYFYKFWVTRSPNDPEGAWLAYKQKVNFVNERYGSKVIEGFRTDRGRVYLRYGPPNTITEEPYDPQAYPYEIWHYYELGQQTNVKFIFYNHDLVTNNYELLHSDYIGEIQDPAWQMKLVKRLSPNSNPDITTPNEYWGGHAGEYYKYNRQ